MKSISLFLLALIFTLTFNLTTAVRAEEPTYEYEKIITGYWLVSGVDMAVDLDGNAYVIAYWYENHSSLDILVLKLDPAGNLVWSYPIVGFAGGHDYATDIILYTDNNIWLTGWTSSPGFPTTPDALDRTLTGFTDAFLMKLSSIDGSILYSTFLGGDYVDRAQGIALKDNGEIILVGSTGSTDFPTTPNAYQGEPSAPLYIYEDAFITRLSADGKTILYSTYFGGFKDDGAKNVALDDAGNIIFSGSTNADDFPLVNPIQSNPDSIFISKLSADGSTLQFSTYLGGENVDYLRAMSMDSENNVYITGSTRSVNFPTTPGAFQEEYVGEVNGCQEGFYYVNCYDGFLTKLSTNGSGLIYSTYIGGYTNDEGHNLAVDDTGCAYVVGYSGSHNFLGSGNTGAAIFVTKFNNTGSNIVYAVTKESSSANAGHGIAVDALRDVYFTGAIGSPNDLYIAKLTENNVHPDVTVSISSTMTKVPRYSNFLFDVQITNNETTPQKLKAWTAGKKLPNGKFYEPLLGPISFTLKPGETKNYYNIQQYIGSVPLTTYRYYVRIGADFPGQLYDEDYVNIEVIP